MILITKDKIIRILKNRGLIIDENDIEEIRIDSTCIFIRYNNKMTNIVLDWRVEQ